MSASIYSLHDCQRQGCEITIRGPAIKQGSRISKSRSAITGKLVCNMLNYPQSRGRWGGGTCLTVRKKEKKKKRKQRDWVKGTAPWGRYERLDRQTDRKKNRWRLGQSLSIVRNRWSRVFSSGALSEGVDMAEPRKRNSWAPHLRHFKAVWWLNWSGMKPLLFL